MKATRLSVCLIFLLLMCWLLSLALSAQQPAATSAVDFQRVVRPILSNNCFHCHGPDRSTRMAKLRLDTREGAFAARKNGTPVVPGNPRASLLYQRITHADAARRMPPEDSHKTLTAEQKEILRRWIEQGAPWKEHWSFSAPMRPELPAVKAGAWVRNPIDRFILARLEAAGLQPAPEADRRTLIRRVSLDLTGLPPAPAEVEAFVNDQSEQAYEQLVDRLLASKHWGEHRARYWLDAARYGDTHGIHHDNYREMWPYRDWVIEAFNHNLSFDRFAIEQLAGDLLPNRTLDQQIASGFNRCNVTTNEGGVILEEVEAIYAKDRAETTGTAFLGLTVGCATCHDHKFDPILQKDFYALTAFFRNTTQATMDGSVPDTPPVLVLPRAEDRARWGKLSSEADGLKESLLQARQTAEPAFETWLRSAARRSLPSPLDPASQLLALSLSDQARLNLKGQTRSLTLPEGVSLTAASLDAASLPGLPSLKALHFGAQARFELPNIAWFAAGKPFSLATWIYQPRGDGDFVVASQSDPEDKGRGWMLQLGAGRPLFRLRGDVVEDDDNGITIAMVNRATDRLKPGTWTHLVVTYDGTREQAGLGLYVNGRAVLTQGGGDRTVRLEGDIRTSAPLRLGQEGNRYFQGGALADFRIFTRVITEEEAYLTFLWPVVEGARRKPPAQLSAAERDGLRLYFLNHEDSAYRALAARLKSVVAERRAIRRRGAVTLVMQEKTDSPPMAHILFRGQYDQPREQVEPDVPSALPPLPAALPRNRLGLAQWLVDPTNPLTARVTVNRFWQEVFGRGLVKTAEDFGSQGEAPSHPELLDWLAVEFRESGWDVKKFFKLLATSAAYRQSAATTAEKLKTDPDNRLLSRGPRFRMDGEMVRDYALAAAGLLVPTIGGPSVKPYQPDGIWEAVAMPVSNTRFYRRDSGEKLYRRSLYTFWKRSAPPASMEIFGAPTRETCTVRRERTNTPLQALVTMNDPQFVEAARQLAQRAMLAAGGDFESQLDFITARLLARRFAENERAVVKRAWQDYRTYYAAHLDDARKLLATGESRADRTLPVAELAALSMVANQLMNLDEALNK